MAASTVRVVVLDAWRRYRQLHGEILGAGLALYALMSAAPLTWLAVGVASVVLERGRARAVLVDAIETTVGHDSAVLVGEAIAAVRDYVSGTSTVFAVLVLLWAASRFFVQLQTVLNLFWEVPPRPADGRLASLRRLALERAVSFLLVLGCGALLLASVVVQAALTALLAHAGDLAAGLGIGVPTLAREVAVSTLLWTGFVALVYRLLPDARVPWPVVWTASAAAALAIVAGAMLVGAYVAYPATSAVNAALGSVALLTLWVYYACQVLLFGAAATRAWVARTEPSSTPSLGIGKPGDPGVSMDA